MAVDVSVESNLKMLKQNLRAMEKQVVPQSTVRTLNRVAESTKSESAKFIAPQIGSRQAGVKRRIETRQATFKRLWASLLASEKPLRLIEFVVGSKKPTQQKGGKRGLVKAKAWGKVKTYRSAFIAPQRKGSSKMAVYLRKSGKRLPVKQLYGPGVKQLFKQEENNQLMQAKVLERFAVEFMNNLNFYLSKMRK